MKINPHCRLRSVGGENIIIMPGKPGEVMTKLVSFNESSVLLWESLKEKDFEIDDVAAILTKTYEVSEEQARLDAEKWVEILKQNGVLI